MDYKIKILNELNLRLDNITDKRKQKLITSILKNKNWYYDLNLDTTINILTDLGYNTNEAINIYKMLINK